MFYLIVFVILRIEMYLLDFSIVNYVRNKTLKKILENRGKCWKSQGHLSVRKSGNHEY